MHLSLASPEKILFLITVRIVYLGNNYNAKQGLSRIHNLIDEIFIFSARHQESRTMFHLFQFSFFFKFKDIPLLWTPVMSSDSNLIHFRTYFSKQGRMLVMIFKPRPFASAELPRPIAEEYSLLHFPVQ